MPSAATLAAFLTVTAAVMAIPGPSVVFAVTRTLESGRGAGLVTVLGLETGLLVHVVATSAGLSAVVASSETALSALRVGGAAYLLLLAWRQLRAACRSRPTAELDAVGEPGARRGRGRLFVDGCLVDMLNPKTLLFFLALLPVFIDPGRGPETSQVMVLGLVVVLIALVCDLGYVLVAARVAGRLRSSRPRRVARRRRRVGVLSGGVYGALAIAALLAA